MGELDNPARRPPTAGRRAGSDGRELAPGAGHQRARQDARYGPAPGAGQDGTAGIGAGRHGRYQAGATAGRRAPGMTMRPTDTVGRIGASC